MVAIVVEYLAVHAVDRRAPPQLGGRSPSVRAAVVMVDKPGRMEELLRTFSA